MICSCVCVCLLSSALTKRLVNLVPTRQGGFIYAAAAMQEGEGLSNDAGALAANRLREGRRLRTLEWSNLG